MKISKLDEKLLLERLRSGDTDAYSEIYRAYHPKLFRYAHSLSKDTEVAEDLVQEQLLTLWKKREQLSIESLNGYLYRLVFNAYVDYYKAEKRNSLLQESLRTEAVLEVESTDSELNTKRLQILHKIIEGMPEKRREIFILSKLKNYEYQEIADMKGISVRTVESQIRKALITMRTEIARLKGSETLAVFVLLEPFL